MNHRAIRTLAGGIVALIAGETHAQSTGFWLVGLPEGASASAVQALSRDGLVAVGGSWIDELEVSAGFRWTAATGRFDWGLLPGMPKQTAVSACDDSGQIVAGTMPWGPFRRVGEGPLENLGVLPGYQWSDVAGMSGDGSVIVGTSTEHYHPQWSTSQAYRWTKAGGLQSLGKLDPTNSLSDATAISRDGSTIVGTEGYGTLFTWTENGGFKKLLGGSSARGINADGSVIVGSLSTPNWSHAARWENGQWQDLASPLHANTHTTAFAVSDGGDVVLGSIQAQPYSLAFVWSLETGMLKVPDYLALFGVEIPSGYQPEYAIAISGNGRTFAGYARNVATKQVEGWVATVPAEPICVADCDGSGVPDIDDFLCFQTLFVLGDLKADCDKNLVLEIDDFLCFQTAFSLGC